MWGPFLILAPLGHRLTRASAVVATLVVALGEGYAVVHLFEMDVFKALAVNAFNGITAVLVCTYLVFSRRVASYRESQRRADARARRHFTLFVLVIGGVSIVVFAAPAENTIDRVSMLTAWQFLVLLAVVLLIGPIRLLRTGRLRYNMYLRRDLGIWAGITGLMHLFAGTGESMTPAYIVEFVNVVAGEGSEALRKQLFIWATIVGLVIGVMVLLLLLLSNDAAIRRLGIRWWKGLHRTSYAVFALTIGHAVAFQVLEGRVQWLMIVTVLLGCTVMAIQMAGVSVQRRRRQRRRSAPK
jgi:sulfoxide reductase heme-binding subunit YedZ